MADCEPSPDFGVRVVGGCELVSGCFRVSWVLRTPALAQALSSGHNVEGIWELEEGFKPCSTLFEGPRCTTKRPIL